MSLYVKRYQFYTINHLVGSPFPLYFPSLSLCFGQLVKSFRFYFLRYHFSCSSNTNRDYNHCITIAILLKSWSKIRLYLDSAIFCNTQIVWKWRKDTLPTQPTVLYIQCREKRRLKLPTFLHFKTLFSHIQMLEKWMMIMIKNHSEGWEIS